MPEYVGSRIVPKHGGIWNSGKSYEPLIIVLEEATGDSYISRKPVPPGTTLEQKEYWALCQRFSEQMQLFREAVDKDVADMKKLTDDTVTAINKKASDTVAAVNKTCGDTVTAVNKTCSDTVSTVNQKTEDTLSEMTRKTTAAENLTNSNKAALENRMKVIESRQDANVTASTDRNANYAAELVDARVGVDGKKYASAGEAIRQQIADILYKPIEFLSAAVTPAVAEIGAELASVLVEWKTNKEALLLTVTGESVPASEHQKTVELTGKLSSSRSFFLQATDERGTIAEANAVLSVYNGIYYGAANAPEVYDSAFILGLTRVLSNAKGRTVNVNAGAGKYVFYCLPERLGTCVFTVGGFTGGFQEAAQLMFTNASGYTEKYRVYRSDNANLGSTAVVVA